MRVPVPPSSAPDPASANRHTSPQWQWESAIERSLPGTALDSVTGTGKISAMVPLQSGVRAPARRPAPTAPDESEVDGQPSVQMRVMRAGNLARATIIVSSALLLSRVLGLFRTSLFAYTFGAGTQADAYTYAFTLPDMIFTIVAGGALASAFIPIFTGYLVEKRDRDAAWRIASSALNLALVAVTGVAILGILFAPQVLNIILHPLFVGPKCSGADQSGCEGPIVVQLTRIMLLQPIFLGGATIAVSVLQARQSFVLPALGQIIYTLSLIGGIFAAQLDARTGIFGGHLGVRGAAWGVVAGAALQFAIQIPGLARARMRYSFSFDLFNPGIREMFRLMGPRLLNAVMLYVSVIVNRSFLSLTGIDGQAFGYVTAFTLILLPNGIFGMAVSQAAFPTLAAYVVAGEGARLRATVMRTMRGIIYLAVPSALGILVLSDPLSRLILAHGAFDLGQLPLVVRPLIFFAFGLPGLALVEILTRTFYALQDTRTPTQVSILQFLFSIGLSVVLLGPMGASGLALASSLAWTGEALVLVLLLRPRLGGLDLRGLEIFLLNTLAAGTLAALAAFGVYLLIQIPLPIGPTSTTETAHMAVRVLAAILAACVVYLGASRFLHIDDAMPFDRIVRRILRR